MKSREQRLEDFLREICHQEFVTDAAWESKECRKWIKAVDKLLDEEPKGGK